MTPPSRNGFGSRLIQRQVSPELGGSSELRFEPEGLVAVIRMKLPQTTASAASAG